VPEGWLTPGFQRPYSPGQMASFGTTLRSLLSGTPSAAAVALLLAAAPLAAQSFAVGGGASIVSDQGTLVDVKSFDRWGVNVFGEVSLERAYARHNAVFQLRWSRFSLPGGAPDAPTVRADAGLLAVAYRWREEWWEAGLFAGGGVYHFAPNDPGPGQVMADPNETVVGLWGGLETMFHVSQKIDFRLELSGHLPRAQASHRPIFLTALLGYHF
jgi:hypothetical protein